MMTMQEQIARLEAAVRELAKYTPNDKARDDVMEKLDPTWVRDERSDGG